MAPSGAEPGLKPPRRTWAPPPLPREHGAWAMLLIPQALGLAAARRPGVAALLLLPALFFLFLSRYAALPAAARLLNGRPLPAGFLARRLSWTAVYLGASLACLLLALLQIVPESLAATLGAAAVTTLLGAGQTALALAGRGRSLLAELLGMAGLASSAPLLVAASGRPLNERAIGAGIAALAYFVSSLVFVRAYRDRTKGGDPNRERDAVKRSARVCAAAHLLLGACLLVLWRMRVVPPGALLAFLPVFARTAWGLARPPPSIRALGWREVAVAVLFTAAASAAFLDG